MVAVRTRSRRARQKVSDGNPRSGADRGGRANKARAPASSSPGDSRSSECSRVDTGRRRRLAASSAGDFDLGRGRRATKDGLGAFAQITQPQTGFWLFRDRVAAEQGAICGFCSLALTRQTRSLPRRRLGVTTPKCREPNTGEITASEKCHARFRTTVLTQSST